MNVLAKFIVDDASGDEYHVVSYKVHGDINYGVFWFNKYDTRYSDDAWLADFCNRQDAMSFANSQVRRRS